MHAFRGEPTYTAPHRPLLSDAGWLLLLAAAYFLTARASMQLAYTSFVWLPAGLGLAALLLGGLRLAPGIAVGALAAQYSAGASTPMCLLFALGGMLSALTAAWVLQRKLHFSRWSTRATSCRSSAWAPS